MTLDEVKHLLKPESLDFFLSHRDSDPIKFRLKYQKNTTLPIRAITEQIDAYQRARIKFPNMNLDHILYTKKGIEQASGEFSGKIHADILRGKHILDMTGALGFDTIFFSQFSKKVTSIEKDEVTYEILCHNCKSINNIKLHCFDSLDYLKTTDEKFDWIYVDPDRRSTGKREINFKDHQPDVFSHLDVILSHCERLAAKWSPMTDILVLKQECELIYKFVVISVDNECKEVISLISHTIPERIEIEAYIVHSKSGRTERITGFFDEEIVVEISDKIEGYLIIPDKGIIKSRLVDVFAKKLGASRLAKHNDFLISKTVINEMCRCYHILSVMSYHPKHVKSALKKLNIAKATITCRHVNLKPDQVRSNLKISDGNSFQIHITTNQEQKTICIITQSLKQHD